MTTTNTETTNGTKKRAPRKATVPANESKEDKFVRLTLFRMKNVKSKVRQVKNLAAYPHTAEQAARIVAEFKALTAEIEKAFSPRAKNDEFTF